MKDNLTSNDVFIVVDYKQKVKSLINGFTCS